MVVSKQVQDAIKEAVDAERARAEALRSQASEEVSAKIEAVRAEARARADELISAERAKLDSSLKLELSQAIATERVEANSRFKQELEKAVLAERSAADANLVAVLAQTKQEFTALSEKERLESRKLLDDTIFNTKREQNQRVASLEHQVRNEKIKVDNLNVFKSTVSDLKLGEFISSANTNASNLKAVQVIPTDCSCYFSNCAF